MRRDADESRKEEPVGFWRRSARAVSAPMRALKRPTERIDQFLASVWRSNRASGGMSVNEDRSFDLQATAFLRGQSVYELEKLLARRRRETARSAWLWFGFGWLFFLGWLYRLTTMIWTENSAEVALAFTPACVVFFLIAFLYGLQNYQIRQGRAASVGEYLRAGEGFWPR